MVMIDVMMTDMVPVQDEISIAVDFYWGILLGALITSFFWYFILSDHKFTNSNKLTFRLWL